MMERPNYKKRSTLPSIIKLLYLTAIVSTLLTCIFLWFSNKTDETRHPNSSNNFQNRNFLVAIPQEVLQLPQQVSGIPEEAGKSHRGNLPGTVVINQGADHESIASLEIDFDDSFNDYINPNGKIVQNNLSSKDKGTNHTEEVSSLIQGKLTLPTISLMDFEDPGHDIFPFSTQTKSSNIFQGTTTMTLTTKRLASVEFKSQDSMQDRLDLVDQYCNTVSTEGKSYLKNVMLLLDQRTNKWIQVSKFVSKKDGARVFNKRVSLQWCPVFKAASTPWMAVMMKLKNYLTPEMEQLIRSGKVTFVKLAKLFHMNVEKPLPYSIQRRNSEAIMKTNSPLLSMLIVRHPFERLLSAYRDKLERVQGRDYYHVKYGLPIVQRFRYRNKWKSSFSVPLMTLRLSQQGLNDDANLFPADDMMVDPSSNRFTVFGRRASNQRRRMLEGVTPTFDEFVQYLLTLPPAEMDEHWRPMYIDCNACTNSFSLIFKVETMDQDRDYLLSLLGVNATSVSIKAELDQIWRRWTNSVGKDTLPAQAWKTRHDYFSQVSANNLRALYELYEPDFLMFGYKPDKYLDMAG